MTTQQVGNVPSGTVIRYCDPAENKCTNSEVSATGYKTYCCDGSDYCNSATTVSVAFSSILSLLVALYVLF